MPSFFEKLKKGMGIEIPAEEEEKQPVSSLTAESLAAKKDRAGTEEKEKPKKKKVKKIEIKETLVEKKKEEKVGEIVKETEPKESSDIKIGEAKESWLEPVGQLAVDIYQTENELVIQSAIAGVKSEDLDISLEGDVITISGERKKPLEEKGDYFSQECYWGKFSRQIISPVEIDPNRIEATLKNGILTVRAPKLLKEKRRKIIIKV
jgi:HSP20 family protein